MSNRYEYMVRFLGADGGPMESAVLQAKSLSVAIDCASAVGAEIGAANFYIARRADGRNPRPIAVTRHRPDQPESSIRRDKAGSAMQPLDQQLPQLP
jgi:hypothetical protein